MPKWSQDDPKMAPRWPQDGPKMASWRVLEPLGGQDGPKMEPRGFQGRKSQFVPPMLGPKLGPNFGHFWHQSGLQEASRGTWMTCCVKTPILKRKWASQDTSGHEKSSKTIGGVSKIRVCMFTYKVALGRDLGTIFGWFWGPSWGQVGPCWAPSWLTMALEHHSKNWVVKKNCRKKIHPRNPPGGP